MLRTILHHGEMRSERKNDEAICNNIRAEYETDEVTMRILDRLIRSSPVVRLHNVGQIKIYEEFKQELQSRIDYVSGTPAGYIVRTESGESVPKDDWLASAATEMAALDAHIAGLDQNAG